MAIQVATVVAKAGKVVVSTLAARGGGKSEGGSSLIGKFLTGVICVVLVAAFSIIQVPLEILPLGPKANAGEYEQSSDQIFFLDSNGEVRAETVKYYINEQKRLYRYASEKWSGEGTTYDLPNWRWLFALDCALSDNDYSKVVEHREEYERYHERMLKAVRETRSYEYIAETAEELPEGAGDDWVHNSSTGLYERTVVAEETYWKVSFKSYKDIFKASGVLTSGALTEEMKYFAQYECGDYGAGWGDQGAALGFYQFDYRYGLREFLNFCMDSYPGKFDMFKPWSGGGSLSRYEPGLEDAWMAAYQANPEEFAEAQDTWAYDTYYIPAEQIAAEYGITLEGRRDCIKGLFWGLTNLNGQGGVRKYISGADLNDSMSDEEIATKLCEYFIAHAPQPYPASYANRYRNELETILWYLSQPAEEPGGSSSPGVNANSMYGSTFTAELRATLVQNYYKALGSIQYNELTGRVTYDNERFISWYVYGGSKGSSFDGEWIYYNQGEEQWQSIGPVIGSGKTIRQAGCGITSVAMIWATYSGDESITPITVLELGRKAGCFTGNYLLLPESIPAASEEYGLEGEWVPNPDTDAWQRAEDAIEAGGCVMINISSDGSTYDHATSGHFLVWVGLSEDGRVAYLADPGSRAATWSEISDNGEAKYEVTYEAMKQMVNYGTGAHPPQINIFTPV